ncbi:MAG TPA: hypothetical protein VK446_04640 [Methylocystis sp.]|nr:hypothetical protein [Methylocystis sp.]
MNRLLSSLFVFLALFLGRRLIFSAAPPDGSRGGGRPNGHGVTTGLVENLADALGLDELDGASFGLLFLAASSCSVALGWLYHVALGDRAFGVRLNGLIAFASGAFSVILWAKLAPEAVAQQGAGFLVIGAVGSCIVLLALVFAKRALADGFESIATGAVSTSPRQSRTASRIDAISRRRR